jgi:tRNA/rRNA methyltransferase
MDASVPHISFVLVEPSRPENIGASARALKTMGFSDLRLVKPCGHLSEPARRAAYASVDILERASLYESLDEATTDADFTIGTTAKNRAAKSSYCPSTELYGLVVEKVPTVSRMAIVFGREERGLTNAELAMCHVVSRVSMAAPYPSLNLAQAVMVYAHVLSPLLLGFPASKRDRWDPEAFRALMEKLDLVLETSGLKTNPQVYRRIVDRTSRLHADDVYLLHSVCNVLLDRLLHR